MNIIKQAESIATRDLRACYGKKGVFAGLRHFKDYWARDSLFASFGSLSIGDYEITKKNLILLIKSTNKLGQVPIRVGKSTWKMILSGISLYANNSKRIPIYTNDKGINNPADQNSLLIIAANEYVSKADDKAFLIHYIEKLEEIMNWNFYHTDDFLIYEKGYTNWNDSINKIGKVLYTNVCHCHALKCMSHLFSIIGNKSKTKRFLDLHKKAKNKINEHYWNGEYYIDWINKGKHYNYFSTDGNSLAILWDIADKEKSNHIEESMHIFDVNEVPSQCVHPKYPDKLVHPFLKILGLADYHNGISWMWLGAINAVAKYKVGRKNEALELLEKMSNLIASYDGVYEVYDIKGPINRLRYKAEQPFAWNAGMFLWAVKEII